MTTELPTAAEVLSRAYAIAGRAGTETDIRRAQVMLGIARELREGSRDADAELEDARERLRRAGLPPNIIVTDDVELTAQAVVAARAAFGSRDTPQAYDATSYGDQANDQTAIIHVEQPMPVPNDRGSIQALVRHDLVERERVGVARYGTPLQAFNGRDALRDAYEEALDLTCYLRQTLAEREGS